MADSVTFIGKPNLARGLKLPKNYTGTFQIFDPDNAKYGYSNLELARDLRAISLLMDKTKRGELWTQNKVNNTS